MELEIQIPDLPAFIADIGAARDQAETLASAAIRNSVNQIQQTARQKAPHKTGALQRSIQAYVQYPEGRVTVNEIYGTYMELGTRPHDITPKKAKALFWAGAAHPVKRVHHPGTAPRPFFAPAVEESKPYVQDQFRKVIQIITEKMAGKGGSNDLG